MLNRLTIKFRLYTLIVGLILTISVLICVSFFEMEKLKTLVNHTLETIIVDNNKFRIQTATHTAALSLSSSLTALETDSQRFDAIREAIKDTRFETDNSGYYFVYQGTVNRVHPISPKLEGKDLNGMQDKNGIYPVRQLYQAAQNGGGFVDFMWKKPGKGQVQKLGYAEMIPGTDIWIGTGIYVDNIDAYKADIQNLIAGKIRPMMILVGSFSLVLLALMIFLSFSIIHGVTRSLGYMSKMMTGILGGDFTHRIEVRSKDELGVMADSLNTFVARLDTIMGELGNQSQTMEAIAVNLGTASEQVAASAGLTNEQAHSTTAGAEQLSRSMEEVAAMMAQTATNTHHVAAAADEISTTINEISLSTDKAETVVSQAANASKQAVQDMNELGEFTKKIDQATDAIKDISDQTDLLALNATIEAARAGEAGKGFAVVATEIKELAAQTARSTAEIQDTVQGIIQRTQKSILEIQAIESTITEASTAMGVVKHSIGEQNQATDDIRARVMETSEGIDSNSQTVLQATETTKEIAHQIGIVYDTSLDLSENSHLLNRYASGLHHTSQKFDVMQKDFVTTRNRFLAGPVKLSHVKWKQQINNIMMGKDVAGQDQLAKDHKTCAFGKWYHSKGQGAYGELKEFQDIDPIHKKVHEAGIEILNLVKQNQMSEARALNRDLARITDQLFEQLDKLEAVTDTRSI